jgi:hypothetical protein
MERQLIWLMIAYVAVMMVLAFINATQTAT